MGGAVSAFFFYGTLLDAEIRSLVLGRSRPATAGRRAVLSGYRAFRHATASYPVLRPAPGGATEGLVLNGITAAERDRLLWYEGDEYDLRQVPVRLAGGGGMAAWTFLGGKGARVVPRVWELARWRAVERRQFVTAARAAMRSFAA